MLQDGSVLLAYNADPTKRSALTLARSWNGGHTWNQEIVLEDDLKGSFSYPTLQLIPEKVGLTTSNYLDQTKSF